MSKVVHLRGPRSPPADERMRFCLARREMNQAFNEWLATDPTPMDVQDEINDTAGILRQLREFYGSGGA